MKKFFEPLEDRKLMSLVVDLRVAGGGKTATVDGVGDTVSLEIWATATGANANSADEGLQIAVGSLLSSNVGGGAAKGNLAAIRSSPFNKSGSTNGAQVDLDGDGDLDVGSNNNSSASGFFFARSDSLETDGAESGNGLTWKIGTATFTVTSLLTTTGSTNVNFRTRNWVSGALWREDGDNVLKNGTSGSYSVGAPIVIKNTTTVVHTGSISGKAWNDNDSDGVIDSGETNRPNVTVYLDADKDGVKDAGEASKVTDSSGNYNFTGLAAGEYRVRVVGIGGFHVTAPASSYHDVTVGTGASTGRNFGFKATPTTTTGSISGTVFSDSDKDGVLDAGESKLSARKIYIDGNSNGKFDSGEKSAISNASGVYTFANLAPGTYRLGRADLPGGYYISTAVNGVQEVTIAANQHLTNQNIGAATGTPTGGTTGSISGTVFSDSDKDGVLDSGESKLATRKIYIDANSNGKFDSGEKSVLSNASGVYTFTGLTAGTYRIGRADLPGGYYISAPSGGFHVINLAAGQNVTDRHIGAATGTPSTGGNTGSISGTVFSDSDKDGILDASDAKLASRRIYIDANKNGKLDAGETSVLSNASGVYTFSGLAAGSYRIRRADTPGAYYISSPSAGYYDITLSAGQVATNRHIGAALK